MAVAKENLVWIDLEMTGLDPDRCFIVEMATVVTDSNLEIVAAGPEFVLHNTEAELETLSEWSRAAFTKSGLLDRVRASEVSAAEAQASTLEFLREHCEPRSAPLCGNSVHMDRQFLYRHMRELHDFLHYRNVDVSTLKELLRRWWPKDCAPPTKTGNHVAAADIRDSIDELRYYRDNFFSPRTD